MRLHLGILALLTAITTPTLGAEISTAQSGRPVAVRLTGEEDLAVYRFRPGKGIRLVHVAVAAGRDIDLYVSEDLLEAPTIGEAEYRAETVDTLEWITASAGEDAAFSGKDDLFIHVLNPGDSVLEASLLVIEDAEDGPPVLRPGERTRIDLPAGEKTAVRHLHLPDRLSFAGVTAECGTGRPQIRLSRDDLLMNGSARGGSTVVCLGGEGGTASGLWRVEIERPEGVPVETPTSISLEAYMATALVGEDDEEGTRLDGPSGSRVFSLPADDWEPYVVDVFPGIHGFSLEAALSEGDVDLYVSRQHPVNIETMNWVFGSWQEGAEDELLVSGPSPLPVGRYWIRVVHHDGDETDCTLRWTIHSGAPRVDGDSGKPRAIAAGRSAKLRFEDNQEFLWFQLPKGVGPGVWAQVFHSDKDVELAVARSDTMEILQRMESERNDEFLRIDSEHILPPGTRLLVGVYRWSVRENVTAGSLHIGESGRPTPPPGYFPPYPNWRDTSADRALAASVEIVLEDAGGSGVVVSPTGLILTCRHVIEDGGEILISFPTDPRGRPRQAYEAKILYQDEDLDLALLVIDKDVFGDPVDRQSLKLPFVPVRRVGQMKSLNLGDRLRLIGYGESGSTRFGSNILAFGGVVSGFEEEGEELRWILTDCRTGGGNSGGGYFNDRHELVGIHNMAVGQTGSALAYGRPTSLIPTGWCDVIRKESGRLIENER